MSVVQRLRGVFEAPAHDPELNRPTRIELVCLGSPVTGIVEGARLAPAFLPQRFVEPIAARRAAANPARAKICASGNPRMGRRGVLDGRLLFRP
jgi:hypothetical protein